MFDLLIALVLTQATAPAAPAAPDPCNAADVPAGRQGCPAWRSIAASPRMEMFVDPGSVRREAPGFLVEIRLLMPQDTSGGERSVVARHRFDCTRRTYAIIHSLRFDARGARMGNEYNGDGGGPAGIPEGPYSRLLAEFCPAGSPSAQEAGAAFVRPAGEWQRQLSDAREETFYDTVPVERNGDQVTIRIRTVYRQPSDGIGGSIAWLRLDCTRRTGAMQRMALLGSDGAVVADRRVTGTAAEEHPAHAGTPGATLNRIFCQR